MRLSIATATFLSVNNITISIGIAEYAAGELWDQWFKCVADALLRAKQGGRNQVQIAS
jgi:PleD family two-component response regulator